MEDRIFKPTQKSNAELVNKLIQAYPEENYFIAGHSYVIIDEDRKIDLIPTYSIVKATKLVNEIDIDDIESDVKKYFVLDNRIEDKGAFGEVRFVKGRWKINGDDIDYKPKSTRIVKTCFIEPLFTSSLASSDSCSSSSSSSFESGKKGPNHRVSIGEVRNEYNLLSTIPYFKIKYDLISNHNTYTMIMAKVGLISLNKLIEAWRNDPHLISTDQALMLAISLMNNLNTFHKQYGIIHADIKPANTRLGVSRGLFAPKFIDLGLGFKKSSPKKGQRGHYGYMDPFNVNLIDEQVDAFSDQYSLLISIMELFGFNANSIPSSYPSYLYYPEIDYSGLFLNLTDLNDRHREDLILAIRNATEPYRYKRSGFESIRICFLRVLIERLEQKPVSDPELKIYKFQLTCGPENVNEIEPCLQEDLCRNYLALIALDELLSFGKLDSLLRMPLKKIIKEYFHNGHNCADILIDVQQEIVELINRLTIKPNWSEGLGSYLEKTKAMANVEMLIDASTLQILTERVIAVKELAHMIDEEKACNPTTLTKFGLQDLSMFAWAGNDGQNVSIGQGFSPQIDRQKSI